MNQIKTIFLFWLIISLSTSCEKDAEICDDGEAAQLYYTLDCATINGYIILDGSDKTYVFQDEIDEQFQETGIDVCIGYEIETDPTPLTADCRQADIIIITALKKR